jgi:hypothetical protein
MITGGAGGVDGTGRRRKGRGDGAGVTTATDCFGAARGRNAVPSGAALSLGRTGCGIDLAPWHRVLAARGSKQFRKAMAQLLATAQRWARFGANAPLMLV